MTAVPAMPLVAPKGSPIHLLLNGAVASIDFGADQAVVKEFKYILGWVVVDQTQIGVGHAILVMEPPTEVEFFQFCAELLTDEEFGITPEEFDTWVAHLTELDLDLIS